MTVMTAPAGTQLVSTRRQSRLGRHVLLYATLLLMLVPVARLTGSFTTDEGAYRLQVAQMQHGTWSLPYAGSAVDPHGTWFPFVNSGVSSHGWFPYAMHPAYTILLRVASGVSGGT